MTLSQTKGRGSRSWTVFFKSGHTLPSTDKVTCTSAPCWGTRGSRSMPPLPLPYMACAISKFPHTWSVNCGINPIHVCVCVDVCGLFLLTFTPSEMIQCWNLNTFKVGVGKEEQLSGRQDRTQDAHLAVEPQVSKAEQARSRCKTQGQCHEIVPVLGVELHTLPKFICWRPKPQYFRRHEVVTEVIKLRWLGGKVVKNALPMQETRVWSPSQEDPLEKEVATHPSILAWEIPWTEDPDRLESTGSQKSWIRLSDWNSQVKRAIIRVNQTRVTGVLILRGNLNTETQMERRQKAETTAVYTPRRQGCDSSFLTASEGSSPAHTLISGFWPPKLRGNKFLLFKPHRMWHAIAAALD